MNRVNWRNRFAERSLIFVSGLVVALLVVWAFGELLSPSQGSGQSHDFTLYRTSTGDVESYIQLSADASWSLETEASNQAAGVVTSIAITAGQTVSEGTALYTVNLQPVVAAQGSTPSFRTMTVGTRGEDVTQFQAMLESLGYRNRTPSGIFDYSTELATRKWQSALGLAPTGSVALGTLIFFPTLPVRIALDTKLLYSGATVAGGERAIQVFPSQPSVLVPITQDQAGVIQRGTVIDLTSPQGHEWIAKAGGQSASPDGQINLALDAKSSGSICGDQCDELNSSGVTVLDARAVLVPPTRGVVVPTTALLSEPNGSTAVELADGRAVKVTVLATAKGMTAIRGISSGQQVRIAKSG